MKETLPDHVRTAITDACSDAGVSLIDVVVRGQARQLVLDVFIDSAEGIDHDRCRAVSRGIDARLENDAFADRLRAVDVSSPGADTPVKHLWQLKRSVGRTVRVVRTDDSVTEGTLQRVDDDGIDIQPARSTKEPSPLVTFAAADIKEARVVIKF
jgi:ribosome maturation factor RimP